MPRRRLYLGRAAAGAAHESNLSPPAMPSAAARDLLVLGGRIHVLGAHAPVEALLARGGRVVALGSEREVRAAALPGAEVLALHGATATPGLTDAHVHLSTWALARRRVELHAARSLDEGLARIRAYAERHAGGWVLGGGWDLHRWGGLPTRAPLDALLPDRPALFDSHDLHAVWLNSAALAACGLTRDTPDPEGGRIVRDPAGEPTGVLLDNAMPLAYAHRPQPSPAELQDALADAQAALHAWGVTGVHSVEPTGFADFEALRQAGRLRLRVLQSVALDRLDAALALGLRSGFGGEWLRVGGVKLFLDGALGSRTALLSEPYEGETEYRGIETLPPAEFRAVVERAARGGLAATAHALGDAAVERALDVLGNVPAPAALPHRIEHLQLCPPALWARAGRAGIVGSMQPVHLLSDIPAAERHWGHARSRGAYAFAPLLAAGMTLAFGSDVPVETPDPRAGLYAAVRRVGWDDGPQVPDWFPEHRLGAEQALRAYTEGPALAAGAADWQGRLLPGYAADLAVWERDPLACPPEALRTLRCLATVVAGEVVHHAEDGR